MLSWCQDSRDTTRLPCHATSSNLSHSFTARTAPCLFFTWSIWLFPSNWDFPSAPVRPPARPSSRSYLRRDLDRRRRERRCQECNLICAVVNSPSLGMAESKVLGNHIMDCYLWYGLWTCEFCNNLGYKNRVRVALTFTFFFSFYLKQCDLKETRIAWWSNLDSQVNPQQQHCAM